MLFQLLNGLFKKKELLPLSQFSSLEEKEWQERACGIVSMLMLIRWYKPTITLSPSELLHTALAKGIYREGIGWTHAGLASLASDFGLYGKNFDWKELPEKEALGLLRQHVSSGPVIASVYRNVEEKTGGHLLVVSRITQGHVFLYEVAEKDLTKVFQKIPLATFLASWKQRIIVVRTTEFPVEK